MNETLIRRLSIVVPLLCFAIALAVVGVQWNKMRTFEGKNDDLRMQIATVRKSIDTGGAGQLSQEAAEERAKDEEARFVNDLRTLAQQHDVRIMTWTSRQVPADQRTNDANKKAEVAALKDVTLVQSQLEFVGSYGAIRTFLGTFLRGRRLVNVTDATWGRFKDSSMTQLSCTLNRYVVPPGTRQADAGIGSVEVSQ